MKSPKIIRAPFDDLVRRTREQAERITAWRTPENGTDPGQTLIRLFARMAGHVVDRINLLPDRSFLAFTDLLGVSPNPPRAARAPLTFQLVDRSDAEPVIPAGTRVAAQPLDGDRREVVFETTQALATTRAQLVAAIVATNDRYADHTDEVKNGSEYGFSALDTLNEMSSLTYITSSVFDHAKPTPPQGWAFSEETREIAGISGRWLARLGIFNLDPDFRVSLTTDKIRATTLFLNGRPLDTSKDFYPLGEQPRFNDALYIPLDPTLIVPNATVQVLLTTSGNTPLSLSPNCVWEMETASGWVQVNQTTTQGPQSFSHKIEVETQPVIPTISYGVRACWLRVRLKTGHFGRGLYKENGVIVYDPYTPPLYARLDVSYSLTKCPLRVVYFERQNYRRAGDNSPPPLTNEPALYLGFDRPFPNRRIALYVQVAAPTMEELDIDDPSFPQVAWEQWTGWLWAPLGVRDGTQGLTTTGFVEFIGPTEQRRSTRLGHDAHWLRIRRTTSATLVPRIQRILTNTVWATHSTTITGEILGSSNGEADQVFRLAHAPVLLGERIEVEEPAPPSASVDGTAGSRRWMPWSVAPDFHTSSPNDRRYLLDRTTGELRFGDGAHGLVPPRGVRNIRATLYQIGGGEDGRRPAYTITALRTTLAYVTGVTNHEPASGEADWETPEQRVRRGPRQIRHRGRAVTVEDLEDLALEASPSVARATVLPVRVTDPANNPIAPELLDETNIRDRAKLSATLVAIVPQSADLPPTAQSGLIHEVTTFLRARASPFLEFYVTTPMWEALNLTIDFVPMMDADVESVRDELRRTILRFLDPIRGGENGRGWDFGRLPSQSDLLRVLCPVSGVDYIQGINSELFSNWEPSRIQMIYPGDITITAQGR